MNIENNRVSLVGEISTEPEWSHSVYGEDFYTIHLDVARLSGAVDCIPVTVSGRMCNVKHLQIGQQISVYGQFRSFNKHEEHGARLILSVFAQDIELLDAQSKLFDTTENSIQLEGYICKAPMFRTTPLNREITDLLVAVNRSYGKSDYIPCITWGRNAKYASQLSVGTPLTINGRIQSRDYIKHLPDGTLETRTAYEVSVSKLDVWEVGDDD